MFYLHRTPLRCRGQNGLSIWQEAWLWNYQHMAIAMGSCTMIESCGDTLDESHMPLGWPMSIDGAVRQFCMHKRDTIQELNGMLAEFNLQRSSVEINRNTTLWSHNSVWNKKYMDPYPGYTLQQLRDASEHYISAERRPGPERSPRKQYSKWSGDCNTSHEPAHPTISSYSIWADHNANKPPPERSPDAMRKQSGLYP